MPSLVWLIYTQKQLKEILWGLTYHLFFDLNLVDIQYFVPLYFFNLLNDSFFLHMTFGYLLNTPESLTRSFSAPPPLLPPNVCSDSGWVIWALSQMIYLLFTAITIPQIWKASWPWFSQTAIGARASKVLHGDQFWTFCYPLLPHRPQLFRQCSSFFALHYEMWPSCLLRLHATASGPPSIRPWSCVDTQTAWLEKVKDVLPTPLLWYMRPG